MANPNDIFDPFASGGGSSGTQVAFAVSLNPPSSIPVTTEFYLYYGSIDNQTIGNSTFLIDNQYEEDIYVFDINGTSNLDLSLNNISSGDDADLYLYEDSNANSVLDDSDLLVASSLNFGNSDDVINYQGTVGTYFARVNYYSSRGDTRIDYSFDLTASGGNPQNIRVEAEDYISYVDNSPGNLGGAGNRNDDVDLESPGNASNGLSVGYIQEGESLTYNVNAPRAGNYQVKARVGTDLDDRTSSFSVSANGSSTTINFGDTGGWYSWQDQNGGDIFLNTGINTLTLNMNSSGFNIDYVDLVA